MTEPFDKDQLEQKFVDACMDITRDVYRTQSMIKGVDQSEIDRQAQDMTPNAMMKNHLLKGVTRLQRNLHSNHPTLFTVQQSQIASLGYLCTLTCATAKSVAEHKNAVQEALLLDRTPPSTDEAQEKIVRQRDAAQQEFAAFAAQHGMNAQHVEQTRIMWDVLKM